MLTRLPYWRDAFLRYLNTIRLVAFLYSPIGEVIEGMEIVDRFYAGYGEGAPSGKGPSQALIQAKGNDYLESSFPKLTYISKGSFVN